MQAMKIENWFNRRKRDYHSLGLKNELASGNELKGLGRDEFRTFEKSSPRRRSNWIESQREERGRNGNSVRGKE